jgi:hypothetical protein
LEFTWGEPCGFAEFVCSHRPRIVQRPISRRKGSGRLQERLQVAPSALKIDPDAGEEALEDGRERMTKLPSMRVEASCRGSAAAKALSQLSY